MIQVEKTCHVYMDDIKIWKYNINKYENISRKS